MQVPEHDVKACPTCTQPVVAAITNKMSKGQPVWVLVEPDEDTSQQGSVKETWALTHTNGKYFAGQITNRNQRAAMLAAGIRFHPDHKTKCGQQPTTRRRYK